MTSERVLVLEPGRVESHYWDDLWQYRELFVILAWRDVAVRYKQTVIGLAWAILKPLLTTIIFTLIFGRVAKLPSAGAAPYALMVFCGMLPWSLFSSALGEASASLITNANLLSKVYFPRLIVPVATIMAALIDFLVSFAILIGLLLWAGFTPPWQIVLLPAFVLLAVAASVGPSLWASALNVKYRDFRHVMPFVVQLSLYVSPVGFTSALIPEKWRLVYSLNPLAGVIDGFRWCILGAPLHLPALGVSALSAAVLLWIGVTRFRSMERTFADVV